MELLVAKTELNKPTDKRSAAERNNHDNKPPISQIPRRYHLFLFKYRDGSSEANFLSLRGAYMKLNISLQWSTGLLQILEAQAIKRPNTHMP